MAGSGANPALDARIWDRLVAEHGEERARQIMGGEPARRRAQVPTRVGVKAKLGPALVPNPNRVKGVSWRDRDSRHEKPHARLLRFARKTVECETCARVVEANEDHLVLVWNRGRQHRFCPPCGAEAAKGGEPR